MITVEPAFATLPSVVRAFAQRHRLPASVARAGGSIALTVDRQYRVMVSPAPHGQVALHAELMPVPPAGAEGDRQLQRLVQAAAGMLHAHGSTLCIDRQREALVLQQCFPAASEVPVMETALADFTNALVFWRRLCKPAQAAQTGVLHEVA